MNKWINRWIVMAHLVASWSSDRSRKVGAVIVDDRQVVISLGWNDFPRKIDNTLEERHERPEKYLWTEHAERNAFYNAAAAGASTVGCTMYQTLYPCAHCARGVIQAGIKCVVTYEPDWNDSTYAHEFGVTKQMFEEVGIEVIFISKATETVLTLMTRILSAFSLNE